jgi:hypothetical protein
MGNFFFASDFIETDGAERVFCQPSNAVYCSAAHRSGTRLVAAMNLNVSYSIKRSVGNE